jgi:glyoxylase-like metal-dependent hydrolase (beta-lactamase superfamily II)
MDYVDLNFLGKPGVIATAILKSAGEVALIDPGPSTTLPGLTRSLQAQGVGLSDVTHVLLTHIHLDHAGATGSILKAHPNITVFVHSLGAKHLVDPSKLLASAGRLYGRDMERLWGAVEPVPAGQIRMLKGGERLTIAGRDLEVAATPGHASHHVSFFDRGSGVAFVGDVAGIRRNGDRYIAPPTPPPDIDLEAWRQSADRILAWNPETLFLTHFGPFHGPGPHFQELFARLTEWSALVVKLLADQALSDDDRERRFVDECLLEMRRTVGDAEADRYSSAARLEFSWQGLARYWRTRGQAR